MPEIQRYNQGFGCFGPMEKCKDGKWVESSSALDQIRVIRENRDFWKNYWEKEFDRSCAAESRLIAMQAAAFIGWGIIVISLIKYAFTGVVL